MGRAAHANAAARAAGVRPATAEELAEAAVRTAVARYRAFGAGKWDRGLTPAEGRTAVVLHQELGAAMLRWSMTRRAA